MIDGHDGQCPGMRTGGSYPWRGLALLIVLLCTPAMALDLSSLWDFNRPDVSEQRFREALAGASPQDSLILQTQIARSYGLRREFDRARELLQSLQPQLAAASPEGRVRHALELGRSYSSAAHPRESQTPAVRELARTAFQQALDLARAARLDGLAVDAVHMLAFVDTAPADQLKWAQVALELVQSSDQPAARRWEPSIRHNLGYALHQLGRFEEALLQFEQALRLREQGKDTQGTAVAHWMIAWTLRSLNRIDQALAIQTRLAAEGEAAGNPDPFVYEELALLHRARGETALAERYEARRQALAKKP